VDESGRVDEGLTGMLTGMGIVPDLIGYMLESNLYGYSLVELSAEGGSYGVELISRRNVSPLTGRLYPDANGDAYIAYREIAEYGRWVLEFNSGHLGKLNRLAIPALFKKFAKSCWSELCEIYGIPPRYMKTNTTDPAMLDRAEAMMRELGAAAWFVIDTTEEFEFAQGSSTNGDVYRNLIRDCNNEMSMSVSGAIIGQDTENGNYSREESNRKLLKGLIASDRRMVERRMNDTVLPALTSIGWMPVHGLRFRFAAVEDTEFLWTVTKELLPHKEVDSEWITEKFGIPVRDRTVGDFP
jgi:phage gp29-like protein